MTNGLREEQTTLADIEVDTEADALVLQLCAETHLIVVVHRTDFLDVIRLERNTIRVYDDVTLRVSLRAVSLEDTHLLALNGVETSTTAETVDIHLTTEFLRQREHLILVLCEVPGQAPLEVSRTDGNHRYQSLDTLVANLTKVSVHSSVTCSRIHVQ